MTRPQPLFRAIDSLQLPVPDLQAALTFYRDALGQEMIWNSGTAAGLRLPGHDRTELVLQTERPRAETDLLVDDVPRAVERFVRAGGRLLRGPFEIQIGRAALVADPFGNELVLLDTSKGLLQSADEGNVTGLTDDR